VSPSYEALVARQEFAPRIGLALLERLEKLVYGRVPTIQLPALPPRPRRPVDATDLERRAYTVAAFSRWS